MDQQDWETPLTRRSSEDYSQAPDPHFCRACGSSFYPDDDESDEICASCLASDPLGSRFL